MAKEITIFTPDKLPVQRLDALSKNDPWFLNQLVQIITEQWLNPRPIMKLQNSNPEQTAKHLLSEIEEVEKEHLLEGEKLNALELQKEILDNYIFLVSLIVSISNSEKLNLGELAYYNQQEVLTLGKKSNIYELLTTLVKEIVATKSRKAMKELEIALLSLTINLPIDFLPRESLQAVLIKNNRNYPAEYLQVYDPILEKDLNKFEQNQKYAHVKNALAILRYEYDTNLIDLHPHFSYLIHNFKHSAASLERMRQELNNTDLGQPANNLVNNSSAPAPKEFAKYQLKAQDSGLVVARK